MKKYDPLKKRLSKQRGDSCTLTFSEIEEIIGASLPASARTRKSWWGNDKTHAQAESWMRAGWKVARTFLEKRQIHFKRNDPDHPSLAEYPGNYGTAQVIVRNLDAQVVDALKRRASRNKHSLEQELRNILTQAVRPQRAELLALIKRIRAENPNPKSSTDSVQLLREDRDR